MLKEDLQGSKWKGDVSMKAKKVACYSIETVKIATGSRRIYRRLLKLRTQRASFDEMRLRTVSAFERKT